MLSLAYVGLTPPPQLMLEPGDWQLDLSFASANTFVRSKSVQVALEVRESRGPVDLEFLRRVEENSIRREPLFLVDGEVATTTLAVRRGLPGGFEMEVNVPIHRVSGGSFDPLVEGFHGVLGVDQDGRQSVIRDSYLLFMQTSSTEFFQEQPPGTNVGDLVLEARRGFALGPGKPRLVVNTGVKIPTGDEELLIGSGSVDLLAQLFVSRCQSRKCLHGGITLRYLGPWEALGLDEQFAGAIQGGFEVRMGRSSSLIGQLTGAHSPHRDLGLQDIDEEAFHLAVGWRSELPGRRGFAVAVTENLLHFDNGSDIGLYASISQRF